MILESTTTSRDKTLLIAAATLAASLLPFCNYGGVSVSLIGIHGVVSQAQQAMSGLADAGAELNGGGVSTGGLTGSLDLLLLIYLVPISAACTLYFELTAGSGKSWARRSGVLSIVLPLLVPFIAWELFKAFLPEDIRSLMGSGDAGSMGLSSGIGLWAIVLLGAFQTFLSFRRPVVLPAKLEA
jgi:hypothetical protein